MLAGGDNVHRVGLAETAFTAVTPERPGL